MSAGRPQVHGPDPAPGSRAAELRAGDVLLSRGDWHLSQWMAWNAECPYSHAAVAVSSNAVVEARAPRVDVRPVEALLRESPARVDLFRPCNRDGSDLSDAQRERVVDMALGLRGVPFALPRLPGLAWRTLLDHKLSAAPAAGHGPHAIRHDLTCCELVYVVLHQSLGFGCGDRRRVRRPRPTLQLRRLLQELSGVMPRPRQQVEVTLHPPQVQSVPVALITTDLVSSPMLRHVGPLARATPEARQPRPSD